MFAAAGIQRKNANNALFVAIFFAIIPNLRYLCIRLTKIKAHNGYN